MKDMTVDELKNYVDEDSELEFGRSWEAIAELARRLSEAERKLAEAEKDAGRLLIAGVKASGYLVRYHRLQNAPSTRWTWDTDDAKEAYEILHSAIAAQNRDD